MLSAIKRKSMALRKTDTRGFTLIELSVVLVILGLLVGGVLVGQSIIRSAAIRKVMTDAEDYSKAVVMFKDKFQALPGDFSDATANWGTDTAGCPKVYTVATAVPTGTCNGNGNGLLNADAGNTTEERWRAWQHLGLAKLIGLTLNGGKGANNGAEIGYNVPKSAIDGAAYSLMQNALSDQPNETPQIMLQFGRVNAKLTDGAALPAKDAEEIDKKIDDGNPSRGTVRSVSDPAAGTCQTLTSGVYAYNVSDQSDLCALYFVTGIK